MHKNKTYFKQKNGQAMVEFALMAPLMLIIFFCVFYFGLFFHDYLLFVQSVTDGTRYASIKGSSIGSDAVKNRIIQYSKNYNLYLINVEPADLTVTWTSDSVIVEATDTAQLDIPLLSILTIPMDFKIEMPSD